MLKNKLIVFLGSMMALSLFASTNNSNTVYAQKANAVFNSPNIKNNLNEKRVFWENDGTHHKSAWYSSAFRFGLDGRDPAGECIATFPQNIWNIIKGETFYADLSFNNPDGREIRVMTAWYTSTMDYAKESLIDNGDGTYALEMNFNGKPIADEIDEQHLSFMGISTEAAVERLYYIAADPTPTPAPTPHNIVNNNKISDKEQNHGYLSINKTESVSNEICTITVNPLRGYALKEGSLKVVNSTDPTKTYNVTLPDADIEWIYTFVMPENDVVVSAEFIESAIPVPPSSGSGLSGGAIAGIVVGSLIGVGLIAWLIIFLLKRKKKEDEEENQK